MSIQSQIDRINDAKNSIKSAISSKGVSVPSSVSIDDLPALVRSIPQEGGSGGGSGIIDVTELPTSGIDESAVYRMTETIQTNETNVYFVQKGYVSSVLDYLTAMGVPTVPTFYEVDELPSDIKASDTTTFSELNFYVLRTDGKCYMNVAEYGTVLTVGYLFFQDFSFDKGSTENAYAETEDGAYTTFETFKEVVRYFIRENGEWKEITSYTDTTKRDGFTNIEVLSGDVTDKVFSAVDIISGECTDLDESWFIRRDGTYIKTISDYRFAYFELKNATIPHSITYIGYRAFNSNPNLSVVTFKGKPESITSSTFDSCPNLTTINVPWSEGEVAHTPWGATNATINYNYTEG